MPDAQRQETQQENDSQQTTEVTTSFTANIYDQNNNKLLQAAYMLGTCPLDETTTLKKVRDNNNRTCPDGQGQETEVSIPVLKLT